MFPTSSTLPSTFEEYVDLHNIPLDSTTLEGWRAVYEREKVVEANTPAIIPACPSWCAQPAGHEYDGTDGWPGDVAEDGLSFSRFHEVRVGSVTVAAIERNRNGFATIAPAEVLLVSDTEDLTLDKARVLATDLQAAVELLERIATGAEA